MWEPLPGAAGLPREIGSRLGRFLLNTWLPEMMMGSKLQTHRCGLGRGLPSSIPLTSQWPLKVSALTLLFALTHGPGHIAIRAGTKNCISSGTQHSPHSWPLHWNWVFHCRHTHTHTHTQSYITQTHIHTAILLLRGTCIFCTFIYWAAVVSGYQPKYLPCLVSRDTWQGSCCLPVFGNEETDVRSNR